MKQVKAAGIIRSAGHHSNHLLLGRSTTEQGIFVMPNAIINSGSNLEQTLHQAVLEQTGLKLINYPDRWSYGVDIVETHDIIYLIAHAAVDYGHDSDEYNDKPRDSAQLYNVGWHPVDSLPWDVAPYFAPTLNQRGFIVKNKPY